MRLTKDAIRSLAVPPGKSEAIFFDDEVPGFGLRLREGGSRSFVFQYKLGTKQRRMALGPATADNLTNKRKTADLLHARVKLGQDPASEKAEARVKAVQTFKTVATEYLDEKRPQLRPRTFPDLERHLLTHAKALHELQIGNVTRADIAAVISSVTKKGKVTANRVHTSLSGFFAWAMEKGKAEANPVGGKKPHKEKPRDRVLTPPELRLLWNALSDDDYSSILKLLALTGQREAEIAGLRWSEITDDSIVLPGERTKNGRPHVIPLSEPAAAIIAARPKRDDRDLIFGRGTKAFSGWSKCKERVNAKIKAANGGKAIPHWQPHDFRRSFETYGGGLPEHLLAALSPRDREAASGLGIQPHVLKAVTNHAGEHNSGTERHYNWSTYARDKRIALDRWAEHLMAIVEDRASNVTPLRREA
jgi:integrase